MKNVILISVIWCMLLSVDSNSQIQEEINIMSQGNQNSFVMTLPTKDDDLAEKVWQKLTKDFKGKTKYNKKIGEFLTDDGNLKGMSNNTVDIYARILGGKITLWFDLGGSYLNTEQHAERIYAAESVLADFDFELNQALTQRELEVQQKDIKTMESSLSKLDKEKDGYKRNIAKAQEEIAKNEKSIAENEVMQETKKQEILTHQQKIDQTINALKEMKKKTLKVDRVAQSGN